MSTVEIMFSAAVEMKKMVMINRSLHYLTPSNVRVYKLQLPSSTPYAKPLTFRAKTFM